MHVAFRLFINIGHFWIVSLASLIAFVPGSAWNWLGRRYWRPEQALIVIYYDRDCGFCRKTSLLLREFLLPRQVAVTPAQSVPEIGDLLQREVSWVVVDWTGKRYLHWDALVFVARQSMVARPLAWLLGLYGWLGLGKPTYDWIGRNRSSLGRLTAGLSADRSAVSTPSPAVAAFLAIAILFCFLLNLRTYYGGERFGAIFPQQAVTAARALGINQNWALFAPLPMVADYWPIVEGRLRDGRSVDLFRHSFSAPDREAKGNVMRAFPSYRWRKYLNNIGHYSDQSRQRAFELYAGFLCRDWNRRRSGDNALETVAVTLKKKSFVSMTESMGGEEEIGIWPCAGFFGGGGRE
jgi:predicted DCC family thiol-disulfide oxidoreductase YuxK